MKKPLIALFFAVVAIVPCYTINASLLADRAAMSTRDIVVRDIRFPQPTRPEPRSAVPTVLASYSSDISLLELTFTQSVGEVTIYIINDMGQCVAMYDCNTQYESDVFMNIVFEEGSYTLKIIGNDYEGEGYFIIR